MPLSVRSQFVLGFMILGADTIHLQWYAAYRLIKGAWDGIGSVFRDLVDEKLFKSFCWGEQPVGKACTTSSVSSWEGGWIGRDHGESYVWMDVGVEHDYLRVELYRILPSSSPRWDDWSRFPSSGFLTIPVPTALSKRGSGLPRVEQPTDSRWKNGY